MTDSKFKVVIWAAVSTRPQAARDISLPDQIAHARVWLAARGFTEAHPPLIVPGESRQTLVSLSDAERAIPQFKELLDLAQGGAVNLCVITDTDRFRGLLDQVVRALSQYGCQVYSLAQPVELSDPTDYKYYDNDAQLLTFGLAQLMSHADIARFQRKRAHGMAARMDRRGLPPVHIPFGYRRTEGQETNRSAVPVIVETERQILLRMKNDYLAGKPLKTIAAELNAEGVTGRYGGKWMVRSVSIVLTNPFYAGVLRRNMTRTHADPRTRKRVYEKLPADQWITAPGRHEPIWSWEEHQAILEAKARRSRDNRGSHRTAAFSRLLRCEHCKGPLNAWVPSVDSGYADRRLRFICSTAWAVPHAKMFGEDVAEQVRPVLAEMVRRQISGEQPAPASAEDEIAQVDKALAESEAKRTRYEQQQAAGLLTLDRLRLRLAEVDAEEAGLQKSKLQLLDVAARQARAGRSVDRARAFLDRYDAYMAGPPRVANAALREFIDYIVCTRAGVVEIKLAG